ncbi:oligosaccharide flippase family protein [Akkermansiaceae bacterium]|nr:oligosaccharide flippase family protein [Akkermansiaceae bacterium]MDB4804671.1 oligosaccharide flippase family protein [Akkermansiaceae bacterium]
MMCSLISVPLAVYFLEDPEIGLWVVLSQVMSYLLWMDIGLASAVGRKMADAVAVKDAGEINQWWTAATVALGTIGCLLILVGSVISPLLISAFSLSGQLKADFYWLWFPSLLILGSAFSLRAVPGLLTAQNRFHWVPIGQTIFPIINLLTFAGLLQCGFGIHAYVGASILAHTCNTIYYYFLVKKGPNQISWDKAGISRVRFRELFGYSSSFSLIGFMEIFMLGVPSLVIGRITNLAAIPAYNFTSRGPFLTGGLIRRMMQAYYPKMLQLHVGGKHQEFRDQVRKTSRLVMGLGIIAAGVALAGNKSFVSLIAGPKFFVGSFTMLWFSLGIIGSPFMGVTLALLQCGGKIGKSGLVAWINVSIIVSLSILGYNTFGTAGLAAALACYPFPFALYNLVTASKVCGHSVMDLGGPLLKYGLVAIISVLSVGFLVAIFPTTSGSLTIYGKSIILPGTGDWLAGAVMILVGVICLTRKEKPCLPAGKADQVLPSCP